VELVVARIGRAHGIRGQVTVEVRTDDPGERLAPGAVLRTDPADRGPLTVRSAHQHAGTLLLAFDGVADRDAAQALRGTVLLADVDDDDRGGDDEDAWYAHRLVGLSAHTLDGTRVGEVADVQPMPAQDLLVLRLDDGRDVLVPFVRQIVPVVDVAGGRVVLDPPGGLLDPERAEDAVPESEG
jgi:16S rRNA processing protein RimM